MLIYCISSLLSFIENWKSNFACLLTFAFSLSFSGRKHQFHTPKRRNGTFPSGNLTIQIIMGDEEKEKIILYYYHQYQFLYIKEQNQVENKRERMKRLREERDRRESLCCLLADRRGKNDQSNSTPPILPISSQLMLLF